MEITITWKENKPNTINGYSIEIKYLYTSFDQNEINEIKKWCKENYKNVSITKIKTTDYIKDQKHDND